MNQPTGVPPSTVVNDVVAALVDALSPERVILFGSWARGEMTADSDVDLLVVLSHVDDQHRQMKRAYKALRRVSPRPPVDVLVFSRKDVAEWQDVVGHVINEAMTDGRVVYDAA